MNLDSVEILLVEDNENDAELTIRELRKNHVTNCFYRVKDGEEALEFIHATGRYENQRQINNPPKLILLDIQMPKVNGLEVLSTLKGNEVTKDIPVVMLTSSNETPDIQQSYKLGANSYIVKPVNFEAFTRAIKTIGSYWLLFNQPLAN